MRSSTWRNAPKNAPKIERVYGAILNCNVRQYKEKARNYTGLWMLLDFVVVGLHGLEPWTKGL